ncbi:hypothetical protein SAMN04487996_107122 [Dyadobacter soli]|uniref:Uncharacterized protein n=1 Tax=Dyadobacter soli TaxID=659014 RepID=A0A1G7G4Q3_9BACT|nr:hypothetical protein SAMN04487996_107122 [Dyadobacter soli]
MIGAVNNAKISGDAPSIINSQGFDLDQHPHAGLQIHNPGHI